MGRAAALIVAAALVALACGGGGGGGQPTPLSRLDRARAVEADPAPDLPGEYIDLPALYGGPYPATARHVTSKVDYAAQGNSNPPAGGPHWSGRCGVDAAHSPPICGPAAWDVYRTPWAPETLVHNMEHGGVVVWYNTTNRTLIRGTLEPLVQSELEQSRLVLMAPYPDMESEQIALTAWGRTETFPVSEYSDDRVKKFIETFDRRFDPEGL